MSKIVFCALPLSGTLLPGLRLARSLRERGHQVVFAGMADCAPMVVPHGFDCIPMFTDWFPRGFIEQWLGGNASMTSMRERLRFYLDQRRKMIDHERFVAYLIQGGHQEFARTIRHLDPDLLLIDVDLHTYWALMAHRSGVTAMYYSPVLPMTEDPVVPPADTRLPPAHGVVSGLAVRLAWQRYFATRWLRNRAMRLAGIPDSIAHIEQLARVCGYPRARLETRTQLMPQLDWPIVLMCPAELDVAQVRKKSHVHHVEAGVDVDRAEPAFPWDLLDDGKKLVFCSLGSVAYSQPFYQHVIDAVARAPDWQLVMNIGSSLSPADFQRVPGDTILVRRAPQLGLLRRAAVMIHHGGIGSVKECVYFGVPQVAFPVGFDQPGTAMRVAHHGLGVVGTFSRATAARVHALVSQVLRDERFRSRSWAMSQRFRAKEDLQLGAVFIEEFLEQETRARTRAIDQRAR